MFCLQEEVYNQTSSSPSCCGSYWRKTFPGIMILYLKLVNIARFDTEPFEFSAEFVLRERSSNIPGNYFLSCYTGIPSMLSSFPSFRVWTHSLLLFKTIQPTAEIKLSVFPTYFHADVFIFFSSTVFFCLSVIEFLFFLYFRTQRLSAIFSFSISSPFSLYLKKSSLSNFMSLSTCLAVDRVQFVLL